MALVIPIQAEAEERIRDEASRAGMPVEQLAARRLEEADMLWRIHSAAPDSETRLLHRLLRKSRAGMLDPAGRAKLSSLLDEREQRAARRLHDHGTLSRLSGIPLQSLMDRLGISPITAP
jgi:hypothetical protein